MTDPAERSTTLDFALSYAALNLRVLPIAPGTKRPPMNEWTAAATADTDMIRNWFTGMYAKCGVGLAMGRQPDGRFIFAVDVDEHDPAHSGSETLAELQAEHARLPDTWCSITGAGGLHMVFECYEDVRNGKAGDGLDIRGEGGQIVVAPSIHPTTNVLYAWESGYAPWEHELALAPSWLLDIVAETPSIQRTIPPSTEPSPSSSNHSRIFNDPDTDAGSAAEWLRNEWDWDRALTVAGWQVHHGDRNGDVHWTRPGKERRAGSSAVLHPGGPLVVFSTDASLAEILAVGHPDRDGSVSLSPLHFYAATYHSGDLSAAGRAIRRMMDAAAAPTARRLSTPTPPSGASSDPMKRRNVVLTPASKIARKRVQWLWDGRLANGTLGLLAGAEGLGKSTLAYWLAARITRGELPGEDRFHPRSVLVCATEDSWEHTIRPRLDAHDADVERVFRMEVTVDGAVVGELSLPADLADVESAADAQNASLLILDPLMSRLDSRLDSHRDGEVRQALEPLVKSCERTKLAALGLIHFNKSGSTNPLDNVMASKAFTAVARSVHMVVRDPDDEEDRRRIFGTEKNNLGPLGLPTKTFTIEPWVFPTDDGSMGEVGRLRWGADSVTTVRGAINSGAEGRQPKTNEAMDWLRDYMRANGPVVNSADAIKAADKAGHASSTLFRARKSLGLEAEDTKVYGPKSTTWYYPADRHLSVDDPDPPPSLRDIT